MKIHKAMYNCSVEQKRSLMIKETQMNRIMRMEMRSFWERKEKKNIILAGKHYRRN